jgi:predicted ATPase
VQLKIESIGKIQKSTIEMNGITVIAGKNSTGKSTYGKVLYCMFNAFFNAKEAIRDERIEDIRRIINRSSNEFRPYMNRLSKKLIDKMEDIGRENLSESKIRETIHIFAPEPYSPMDEDDINIMVEKIKRSISVDDDKIQKTVISRYFGSEFEERINHVNRPSIAGLASLVIKEKNVDVFIEDNECNRFTDDVGIRHSAIYIDTPFVIDDLDNFPMTRRPGSYSSFMFSKNLSPPKNHRRNILYRFGKEHSDNTAIEEVIFKQKTTNILSAIHLVANGSFKEDRGKLMFMENGLEKPIPFSNVSAGMKPFLIIKRLLELCEIEEQEVLILDEPEVHLHPEWQLQLAEILILLQKEFNLTILITTHSPYFLHAIEVYGKKHGIKKDMNFYLAENKDDYSIIKDVTGETNEIYALMEEPFRKLEFLRCEDL